MSEDKKTGSNFPKDSDDIKKADDVTSNSSDTLSPSETAEKVAHADMQKVHMGAFSTFVLAVLAGALIAIAGVYFTFVTSQVIVTRTFTQVFGGLLFSFGLISIVITGACH